MTQTRDLIYEQELNRHSEEMVRVLRSFRERSDWTINDFLAIERALQVVIEALIGLSRYILKIKKNIILSKSSDVFDALMRENLISNSEHTATKKMVGYRNILVHDYLNVNPAITREIIEKSQFDQIVTIQKKLLASL